MNTKIVLFQNGLYPGDVSPSLSYEERIFQMLRDHLKPETCYFTEFIPQQLLQFR